jgi:hypothetical protein
MASKKNHQITKNPRSFPLPEGILCSFTPQGVLNGGRASSGKALSLRVGLCICEQETSGRGN